VSPLAVSLLDRAKEELGGFLPRLAGAILLLLVGLVVAALVGRLLRRALQKAGLDRLAERWKVHDVLARAGLGRSLSAVVGTAVRIIVSLVVVFAALSLTGLEFLSDALNQATLFLPSLLAAAGLVLAGIVLGGLVRERVDRAAYQMDLPVPLGRLAQIVVIAVFVITAAAQVAVSTAILMALVAILIAAAGATFALAFGLGGRDVAREMSAGRYLKTTYEPGQTISFADIQGSIVSIGTATTVLRTEDGEVRVPNNLLLGSVVMVHGPESDAPDEGQDA
jgi:small-conductance mechanosensitive channel